MAEHVANFSAAATLAAGVMDTVTLNQDAEGVRVCKRTEAGELWVLVDSADDPTVGGEDCHLLPVGIGERVITSHKKGDTVVKLISDSAIDYWVAAL